MYLVWQVGNVHLVFLSLHKCPDITFSPSLPGRMLMRMIQLVYPVLSGMIQSHMQTLASALLGQSRQSAPNAARLVADVYYNIATSVLRCDVDLYV